MKKLLFIVAIITFSASTFAQTSFGIQAGANFASMKSDDDDDVKSKVGLIVGALAEVDFGSSISFRPELNFIQKGFKYDESGYESKLNLNYIELSPNFVYNVPAGTGKVYFGLGPSFAYGFSGKLKSKFGSDPEEEEDIELGNDEDNDDLKAFDFGLNLLAGYKLPMGISLTAGYNLGLANLSFDDEDELKNKGFSIKIAYMFGGNKSTGE
ncbi:MAG: porin family protein [Ferruginibacter sp.]